MKRGSPGGLLLLTIGGAFSLCTHGARAADGVATPCAPAAPCPVELTAEAGDDGKYWHAQSDDRGRPANLVLTAEPEVSRAVTFRADNVANIFGALELHGGVGKVETTDALTFERLLWRDDFRQDNTSLGAGAVQRMFDGRFVLSTDLSWSQNTERWRDAFTPAQLKTQDGAARWHRAEAKLIDLAGFKWSVKGEMSVVDDGYAGNTASQPSGALGMRGERTKVSTQLAAFGTNLSASAEHLANHWFARDTNRATLAFDGLSTTFTSKEIQRQSLADFAQWTSRTSVRGVSFDITPQLLAPDLVGSSAFVPTLVSLSFEGGSATTPDSTDSAERIASFEVLATWTTSLGNTTALYSTGRQDRDIASFGPVGESDKLLDVTQSFKTGAWRFSVGATASALANSSADDGFDNTALSGRFSLRYAPEHGPQFEARLGRSHDEFEIAADDLLQRSYATTLSLALDLSDLAQRALERRDVRVHFDFRHRLDQSEVAQDIAAGSPLNTHNTDTALISFSSPLQN